VTTYKCEIDYSGKLKKFDLNINGSVEVITPVQDEPDQCKMGEKTAYDRMICSIVDYIRTTGCSIQKIEIIDGSVYTPSQPL
jgi:hypothetical protein